MQIGPTCSEMYSNLCFPEVVGVGGSLFAAGGEEVERAEWGVVVVLQPDRWMYLASHSQKPPYFCLRENNRLTEQSFS